MVLDRSTSPAPTAPSSPAARTSRATTSTGCWRRPPASRPSRCDAGCCWSARRGSCARARHAVGGGDRRRLRLAGRVLARVRARLRHPAERVRRPSPPLEAPNGIHFHPPAGLLVPGTAPARRDLTDRLVGHHLDRIRELLTAAAALPGGARARAAARVVLVWFEGEEASARADGRAARLHARGVGRGDHRRAGAETGGGAAAAPVRARRARLRPARARVRDRGAWDDAFVDALCEPPQAFTYGGVLAHVLSYGAIRREAFAGVLRELGADVPSSGDPIDWEASRPAPPRSDR